METINSISYLPKPQKRPILIGVFAVLLVLASGFGIGLLTGAINVEKADACCIVIPPFVPPIIVPPIIPPGITPIIPACTLSANPTSFDYPGGVTTLHWTTTNAVEAEIFGYGEVNPVSAGNLQVQVTDDATYTLRATSATGHQVDCHANVVVRPPPVQPAPVCTLTASPTSFPFGGGTTTLTWTTQNAVSFTIDSVSVTPVPGGSVQRTVTDDHTFRGVARAADGRTINCDAPVTVGPQAPAPICTLTASPTSFPHGGGTTTLTWTTQNAVSFTIDTVSVTPVAGGSVQRAVTENHTFRGVARAADGRTINCDAPVTVGNPPNPLECTLTASPNSFPEGGGNTRLTWTTRGAASFTVDQGVGSLTPVAGGTTADIRVNSSKTFTGTARAADGRTVTCQAPVHVDSDRPEPRCTLIADPTSIRRGDSSTLRWTTDNVTKFEIDQGVGVVTPTREGDVSVSPNSDTEYTGTGTGPYGTVICHASIDVRSSGGGGHTPDKPDVTLEGDPSEQPLSYVYLSQVPYTGLELGPVGTVLYWFALILWSGALAYLVLFKVIPMFGRRMSVAGHDDHGHGSHQAHAPQYPPAAPPSFVSETRVRAPYPDPAQDLVTAHYSPNVEAAVMEAPRRAVSTGGGFSAFASDGALSIEDIVKGLSRETGYDVAPAAPVAAAPAQPAYEAPRHEAPVMRAPEAPRAVNRSVNTFVYALFAGDQASAFETLRSVSRNGGDAGAFITEAVQAIDDAYRARLEGTPADAEIVRVTENASDTSLERVISALSTAIDASYSTAQTGAKLAVTRAIAALRS